MQSRIKADIFEKLYLQPFDGHKKVNLYEQPVERIGHGVQHVSRVAAYIILLVNLLREMGHPLALQLTNQDILYLQIAALCHDAGRKTDKTADIWESESQQYCYQFLLNEGVSKEEALAFAMVITQKDNSATNAWVDLLRQLLQAADALDIMRCKKEFDLNKLKLYQVCRQYNQQDKLIALSKDILQLLADQHDLKSDCKIVLDRKVLAEHGKTRKEDQPELKYAYECANDCYQKIVAEFKGYPVLNSLYHDDPLTVYADFKENISKIPAHPSSPISIPEKEQQLNRNQLRLAAETISLAHDFIVKSLRADELNYYLQFIQSINPPFKRFQLRREPKSKWTVTGKGVFDRTTKPHQYPSDIKNLFSKAQAASYGTPDFHPNIFGFTNRKSKLAGIILHIKDVLLTDRNYIQDIGSINRPYDYMTYQEALEYFNQVKGTILFAADEIEAFKKAMLNNAQGYNEILPRLHWNTDGTSYIFIYSDTLEARLLAKTYARLLENYLKESGLCAATYQVPIIYYQPRSAIHLKRYTEAEQCLDQAEVDNILTDDELIKNKMTQENFEFLLMLPKDKVEVVLNKIIGGKSVLQHILEETYFHIIEFLMKLDKFDIAWLQPFLQIKEEPLLYSLVKRDNNLDLIKSVLRLPGIDINETNQTYGETALGNALEKNSKEALKILLTTPGIDTTKLDQDNNTLSHFPWVFEDLTLQQLLHYPKLQANVVNKYDVTPLQVAALKGCTPTVEKLLAKTDIDVNAVCDSGWTSLHVASFWGHKKVTRLLIQAPLINVNCRTNETDTPLMMAAYMGNLPVVQQLIAVHADLNLVNKEENTALFMAVTNSHIEIVRALLVANANPNITDKNGISPLMKAVSLADIDMVTALLNAKANPNLTDDGISPLHIAAFQGHLDIVKELLNHKAKTNIEYFCPIDKLREIAKKYNVEARLEALIATKLSDPSLTEISLTPYEIAVVMGHQTIADAIKQAQQKKAPSLSRFFTKNPYEVLNQEANQKDQELGISLLTNK